MTQRFKLFLVKFLLLQKFKKIFFLVSFSVLLSQPLPTYRTLESCILFNSVPPFVTTINNQQKKNIFNVAHINVVPARTIINCVAFCTTQKPCFFPDFLHYIMLFVLTIFLSSSRLNVYKAPRKSSQTAWSRQNKRTNNNNWHALAWRVLLNMILNFTLLERRSIAYTKYEKKHYFLTMFLSNI